MTDNKELIMQSKIENKKSFSDPKQEKKIRVELVSKYTTKFGFETTYTEYFEYPASELRCRNWGEYIGDDWYDNVDLFPCFSDLDYDGEEIPAIVFEVYSVDKNNVRNGRAQGLTRDHDGWKLRWETQFKNGKQHGKRIDYGYNILAKRKTISQSFYIDNKRVDAKTVVEWRKKQSEMCALVKGAQIHKK